MTTHNRGNNESTPPGFPLYGGTDSDGQKWRRPILDFSTPGKDSRGYRLFLVEPEVRVYDDPPSVQVSPFAVALRTDGTIKAGSRLRGDILPATFDVHPTTHPGPRFSFKLSYIKAPPGETEPAHIGIEWVQVGRVGKTTEAWWEIRTAEASQAGLPAEVIQRHWDHIEVSTTDLRRVPLTILTEKALAMVGVYARVEKLYKRKPRADEYALDGGGSFRATVIGFDTDQEAPKAPRGRRKRGANRSGDAPHPYPWHHASVLQVAAECKANGLTRAETVAHFIAEHDQVWSEDSVKKMWGRCREIGLLPDYERGTK